MVFTKKGGTRVDGVNSGVAQWVDVLPMYASLFFIILQGSLKWHSSIETGKKYFTVLVEVQNSYSPIRRELDCRTVPGPLVLSGQGLLYSSLLLLHSSSATELTPIVPGLQI